MNLDYANVSSSTTALSLLGAVVLYLLAGWLLYKRGYDLVMQRAVAEWEKLAQAQEKRITLLEQANRQALDENEDLRKRNDTLVRLNLALQTSNAEKSDRIWRLERS